MGGRSVCNGYLRARLTAMRAGTVAIRVAPTNKLGSMRKVDACTATRAYGPALPAPNRRWRPLARAARPGHVPWRRNSPTASALPGALSTPNKCTPHDSAASRRGSDLRAVAASAVDRAPRRQVRSRCPMTAPRIYFARCSASAEFTAAPCSVSLVCAGYPVELVVTIQVARQSSWFWKLRKHYIFE